MKSPITTHVLDTSCGKPASGITVSLFRVVGNCTTEVGSGVTDEDGRIGTGLITAEQYHDGHYRIHFELSEYFSRCGADGFFPFVNIDFLIDASQPHYHVPLLLSPFGYSTYRGS